MIQPAGTSRLIRGEIVRDVDGFELYEILEPLPRVIVPGSRPRVVNGRETLHHIAYDEWGSVDWWWAIADYNDIGDPFTEVPVGTVLIIPPASYIQQFQTRG